jgi:hypothetical protein
MARSPFVTPDTVKVQLKEGDWIEVKKFLNVSEAAKLGGAGVPNFRQVRQGEQEFALDFVALKIARINAYVVAWSFVDAAGNQMKVTPETVECLESDVADEIDAALDVHKKAMDELKKAKGSAGAGAPS